MSPATHFLVGWLTANADARLERRHRALITIAGIAPDFDAFGAPVEVLTRGTSHPLPWFSQFHHILGHNLLAAVVVTALFAFLAKTQRWKTAIFVLIAYHFHLLGDIFGAKGPDGYAWPVPYLLPLSQAWQLAWKHQWALNGWQNFAITGACLALTFYLSWKRGYSPVEIVSPRADRALVETLRRRFPRRRAGAASA